MFGDIPRIVFQANYIERHVVIMIIALSVRKVLLNAVIFFLPMKIFISVNNNWSTSFKVIYIINH